MTALVLVLLPLAGPARAAGAPGDDLDLGKRVALVIGNGAYGALGALPNPPNDAEDIAKALEELKFDVTLVVDGNVDTMRQSLRSFGRKADKADVALFFYAGHGMAVNGENYLVPVSGQIETSLDLRFETLDLTDVRETLEFTGANLKMVILDACRDNPLAKLLYRNEAELGRGLSMTEGLARMDVARASGLFIAYATAPGNVAYDGSDQRNSPFTQALLEHIDTPNTDVRVMFGKVRADVLRATNSGQTPWTEEAMLGEFQFNPVVEPPAPPSLPPDYVAWEAIAANPDPDPTELEAFLANFPESRLRGAAQDKLKAARDPAKELAAWTALQGSSDIAAYEKFLRRYPNGSLAPAASLLLQQHLWAQVWAANDVAGMENFLARFPDGPLSMVARNAIAQQQATETEPAPPAPESAVAAVAEPQTVSTLAPSPADPQPLEAPRAGPDAGSPAEEMRLVPAPESERAITLIEPEAAPSSAKWAASLVPEADLSPESLDALQRELQPHLLQIALKALGHYQGRIDGQLGSGSRRAARAFQESIGAPATGTLQPAEVVALMSKAAESGDADSQNIFGGMFQTGAGVTKDPAAAARWYLRSAESDNGYGQMNLGLLYLNGVGVDEDRAEARRWLEAAVRNGVEEARAQLDELR